jgi:hypothetical protein
VTLTAPAPSRASKTCNRCKCALREPARYCGMCEVDTLEAIVLALTEEPPASTLAIWKLRDRGLTGRQHPPRGTPRRPSL